jgi:hypothetical protein
MLQNSKEVNSHACSHQALTFALQNQQGLINIMLSGYATGGYPPNPHQPT